jgi:hypothetical protein
MALRYLHLCPEEPPPELITGRFRAVIVSEAKVAQEWQNRIAEWLLERGCLYVVAWGVECEAWHDTVDWTNLEAFDYGDIPDDKFVTTTWHANEPLKEALWFAGHCAQHPDVELDETVIIHVADAARGTEMLATFSASQSTPNE